MRKFLPALLFCLAIVADGVAQEREIATDDATDVENVWKLTILSPGIGYEHRVGKYQTLYLQGYVGFVGGAGYSLSLGNTSYFYLVPAASLEYRYYYNFEKRKRLHRRVAKNSVNYLSPFFRARIARQYWLDENGYTKHERKFYYTVGGTWGLQRNYKRHFSLDLNIGLGYQFKAFPFTNNPQYLQSNNGKLTIPGRVSFGFWLN